MGRRNLNAAPGLAETVTFLVLSAAINLMPIWRNTCGTILWKKSLISDDKKNQQGVCHVYNL